MHFSLASTKAATKYEKSEEIQTFVCKHYIVLINLIYITALTDNWTNGAASRHTIASISHTRPSPRIPQ